MTSRSELLITTTELRAALGSDAVPVVADCRFALGDPRSGERQYLEAHIPGAHYLHLDRDLAAPRAAVGGRHPLPGAIAFQDVLRRVGLDEGRELIAYDDSRGAFAARLWWLAHFFGHARVRILDGGLAAWRNAGYALDSTIPDAASGTFTARENRAMVLDYAAVQRERAAERIVLVDAREERRYRGIEEPIDPKAGHIPGAINRPWTDATDTDGRFLPADALARGWSGIGDPAGIVAYCGSGVTACVNLFSLELAGLHGARLYAGSWSDWCSRTNAPIATGEQ